MKKQDVVDIKGKKIGQITLPKIFESKILPHIVHKVYTWQMFNSIPQTANTKTRGERSGGGVKPWRQKGTGRARFGSTRNPIWRKGGVVFGPTPEKNLKIKILKRERKIALKSLLSEKVKNKKLIVLDNLKLEKIKTKDLENILVNLKISKKVLIAIPEKDEKLIKSIQNLAYAKPLTVSNLNILDLLKYEILLTTKDGIKKIEKVFDESEEK